MSPEPCEATHNVLRIVGLKLQEVSVVDNRPDHTLDVVGLMRRVRHERVELGRLAVDRVGRHGVRRRLEVVLRQEREQVARVIDHRLLPCRDEVGDTGA